MADRTILRCGTLLTMVPGQAPIEDGIVEIVDGLIVRVGPTSDAPREHECLRMIDLGNCIVMPGLVNAHCHLPMSLYRGMADDLPLDTWLNERVFPAEARFTTPENVRIGTRLSVAELLLSGTTTVADGYFLEEQVSAAGRECGIRGIYAQGMIDFPAPGVTDAGQAAAVVKRFVEGDSADPLARRGVFAHSPYTCSRETLLAAKMIAREHGTLFFIHAAETKWEVSWCRENTGSVTPIRYLASLGVLDPETVLVHAVHIDDEDIAVIAGSGAGVVTCGDSNMKLGSGAAPVWKLLAAGVPVGLGTDSAASNNDLDMFGEMAQVARMQKLLAGDPSVLDATETVRLTTHGGAQVLGRETEVGMLKPGMQADIIGVNTGGPHALPLHNPCSFLVYSASGANVDFAMVAGEPRVIGKQLTDLDRDSVQRDARNVAQHIRRTG